MDIEKLFREILKKYSPYEPGEQTSEDGWLKLNTNENPYPPIPEVVEELKDAIGNGEILRTYPDTLALEVRKAVLNQLLRDKDTLTNRNSIFIGNGSDEIFDVIYKVFINPGNEIVIFYPTYGYYKVLANLYDAKINEIKLDENFNLPDSTFNVKGKLMFINSPNNPNGKSFGKSIIAKICEKFPGIVVVDEAYADFSEFTCLSLLKTIKNLIVVRTLSKTFSVASLRIGYALADPKIIKEMNRVKLPYNTNHLAQITALLCIKYRGKFFKQNQEIISERKRLTRELNKYDGIEVLPSDANFIFIKFDNKSTTLKFLWDLKDMKILVRHFSQPGLYNYMRLTIGTEEQNNIFLNAFEKIAEKYL